MAAAADARDSFDPNAVTGEDGDLVLPGGTILPVMDVQHHFASKQSKSDVSSGKLCPLRCRIMFVYAYNPAIDVDTVRILWIPATPNLHHHTCIR